MSLTESVRLRCWGLVFTKLNRRLLALATNSCDTAVKPLCGGAGGVEESRALSTRGAADGDELRGGAGGMLWAVNVQLHP